MSKRRGIAFEAWSLDQLTKSQFFHEKLHTWGLLEVEQELNRAKGESLGWDIDRLRISKSAWDKVIHRGIKPVLVFAHPTILQTVRRSTSYYRMLSMVSQKSMSRVALSVGRYEHGQVFPDELAAVAIAKHLNEIISNLVELDAKIDRREFDLWRGMAAGTQAQGSWQNAKGIRAELVVRGILRRRLNDKSLVSDELSSVEDKPQMVM